MGCPALSHVTCQVGKASSLRHHSSGIQTHAAMPGFVHKCIRYKFTPSHVCRQSPKIQWRINREGSPSQPLYKPSQASALIEHTQKAIIANHCHYHYPKKLKTAFCNNDSKTNNDSSVQKLAIKEGLRGTECLTDVREALERDICIFNRLGYRCACAFERHCTKHNL